MEQRCVHEAKNYCWLLNLFAEEDSEVKKIPRIDAVPCSMIFDVLKPEIFSTWRGFENHALVCSDFASNGISIHVVNYA
jgi:hypothetical protein